MSDVTTESLAEKREHDLTMHLFSVSAAMVGVCLTAIGIMRLIAAQTSVQSIGDECLALDSVVFVVCASMAFASFKTRNRVLRHRLRLAVDTLFLTGLTAMAGICGIIAYALV